MAKVFLAGVRKGSSEKLVREAVRASAETATDFSWLSRGDSVFIKPALNSGNNYPATTNPAGIKAIVLFDEKPPMFAALVAGKVDAVICDTPIANSYVNKNATSLKIVGDALTTENYGIAVAKGKTELLEKINQGLAAVKAAGTIDTLVTKWLTS